MPGWPLTRIAVERAVLARGWRYALSSADADLLVVCGRPGDGWGPVLDGLCAQMPGPAARSDVVNPTEVSRVLDQAALILSDHTSMRATSVSAQGKSGRDPGADSGSIDSPDREHGADHHSDGDTDEMDMPMPGGIPLAAGDQDRDGLEMDVLSVRIGPVLPAWPAGLELRCVLHGDMIAHAEQTTLPGGNAPEHTIGEDRRIRAALGCDGVARLVALAGRNDAASALRGIRDALLDGVPTADCSVKLSLWSDRLLRSRLLRWSLRGLGGIDGAGLSDHRLENSMAGDVHDRLLARMAGVTELLAGEGTPDRNSARGLGARAAMDALPTLVTGLDLAAARLVVASIDPDVAALREGSANG